jgi:hypothetical protein
VRLTGKYLVWKFFEFSHLDAAKNQTVVEVKEVEAVTRPSTFNWVSLLLFPSQDRYKKK